MNLTVFILRFTGAVLVMIGIVMLLTKVSLFNFLGWVFLTLGIAGLFARQLLDYFGKKRYDSIQGQWKRRQEYEARMREREQRDFEKKK